MEHLVIYVDVDDTLIRSFGTKQIPIPRAIEYIRAMHGAGHVLYCWSRGGGEYAEKVANSLGIHACFAGFLPKPDVLLDDRLKQCLDHCQFVHPNNASAQSV
jgi:cation transport ATPase